MSLLSDCETESLAAEIEALLTDTAGILRETKDRDARGNTLSAWGIEHAYPCALTRTFIRWDEPIGGSVGNIEDWLLTLPLASDVLSTDRVQVNGVVYEISGDVGLPTTAISRRLRVRKLPNVEAIQI